MTNTPRAQALGQLRAPWLWGRNDGSLWAMRLYFGLAVLLLWAPAVAALWSMPPRAAWTTVGGLLLTALTMAWSGQFAALLRLDHPHAAHTVPGHSRALRRTALGLWALLVAACSAAATLGAALLYDGGWPGALRVGLVVALGTGTLLLFVAASMRWWWLWVPVCVAPSFIGVRVWRNFLFGTGSALQQLWQAQPLAVTLAVLVAQGLLLTRIFGRGDAEHVRIHASRERLRRASAQARAGQRPALAAYGLWGERLSRPVQLLADTWLRHCLSRAKAEGASVMARAEVVLYGPEHWARQLPVFLGVQAFLALCIVVTASFTGLEIARFLEAGRLGIGIGLGVMAFGAVLNLPAALWASRREQALLVLLPGMPQGAALNRALAWRQWRQCLLLWAALMPAFGVLLWVGEAPALAFLGTALPLSAWLWRDLARQRGSRPGAAFVPLALCTLASVASMLLLSRVPGALWPWALGLLVLTAVLLRWRWQRLAQWPGALPAGRLA